MFGGFEPHLRQNEAILTGWPQLVTCSNWLLNDSALGDKFHEFRIVHAPDSKGV